MRVVPEEPRHPERVVLVRRRRRRDPVQVLQARRSRSIRAVRCRVAPDEPVERALCLSLGGGLKFGRLWKSVNPR